MILFLEYWLYSKNITTSYSQHWLIFQSLTNKLVYHYDFCHYNDLKIFLILYFHASNILVFIFVTLIFSLQLDSHNIDFFQNITNKRIF